MNDEFSTISGGDKVVELAPARAHDADKLMLFVVWIDTTCGYGTDRDWVMNSAHLCPAKPLQDALDEAAECRRGGFPTKVLPEGMTPS